MAIFGSGVVAGKLIAGAFPSLLAAGLTSAVALAVLGPLLLLTEGVPSIARRDAWIIFLQALIGSVLWRILVFEGLRRTTAVESGIVSSTIPAAITVVSVLFLKERLTRGGAAGVALSVVGILAINAAGAGDSGADLSGSRLLGNLLIFGSVVSDALFTIFGKVAVARVSPLAIATLVNLFGLVLFTPFALWQAGGTDLGAVPLGAWAALVYFGVMLSAVVFVLWIRGVAVVPASTAAVFTGVLPISAVALSYLFLHEPFAPSHLVGLVCVLGGIWLVTRGGTAPGDRGARPNRVRDTGA